MRNHFQNNLYKIHLGKNGSQETLCARCEVRFFTFLYRVDHFLQVGCFWLGSCSWRPHLSRRVAAVDRKAVYSWSNLSIQKWKSFIFKMGIYIFWFSNSPVSSQHPAMFDYKVNPWLLSLPASLRWIWYRFTIMSKSHLLCFFINFRGWHLQQGQTSADLGRHSFGNSQPWTVDPPKILREVWRCLC